MRPQRVQLKLDIVKYYDNGGELLHAGVMRTREDFRVDNNFYWFALKLNLGGNT